MVKKYIVIILICLILLGGLSYFSNVFKKNFTGNSVYSLPEDGKLLNLISNNAPIYFCSNENKFYGIFNFKVIERNYLPADAGYASLLIYNRSSNGNFNYTHLESNFIRTFMMNTSPAIGEPVPLDTSFTMGLMGGILSGGGIVYIYNSTDPDILANTYSIDLGIFDSNLPLKGNYNYILNFTQNSDGSGGNLAILDGSFSVKNCTLGLNNLNLDIIGGGNFYNTKNVNCSANVDGNFFSDLTKSSDKISFNLDWYNGSQFFNYKTLVGGDSGVSCNMNSCNGIISVSESHLNKWRCSVNVSNDVASFTKSSNNITMLNSAPAFVTIPNLSFGGGFEEEFIKISDYISDKNNDILTYSKQGGTKINLSINSGGNVNITSPYNYSLSERFIFSASDGTNTTQSNLFYIKIVEGYVDNFTSNLSCTSNWSLGDWSACNPSSVRTRIVIDLNNCNNVIKPSESESCTYTSTDELATPPTISQPKETKKGTSIFENKFLLSGIILGLFLLLLVILLLISKIRRREKSFEPKIKQKTEIPKEEYKPKIEGAHIKHVEEELNVVNLNEIVKYVKDMLNKGANFSDIKDKLISSGWKKEDVEEAINFVRVKDYVGSMLSKGESKEKITRLLKEKGWKEDLINRIFKE